MQYSLLKLVAVAAALPAALGSLVVEDAANIIVARTVMSVQDCYTNPSWVSCNTGVLTATTCASLAAPSDQLSCACATASSIYGCYTSYCSSDDTWATLSSAIASCGLYAGGGGGGGSGGGSPASNTAMTTAPGGSQPTAAAASTSKNSGSITPTFVGGDRIIGTLFALAWAVGLAGFFL
ncbi:hypothetical protein GQ53DRAFT_840849 [Thozetella sp. PMI_491]|nr:hypothetical protein GQ53DRAFT_840849 [Thozetella sp. PMI_491]